MRIGIDGRPLQTASRYRGIGTYTFNLLENLASLDHAGRCVVFGFRGLDFPALRGGNLEFAPVLANLGVDRRWIWESLYMNGILSRYGLDLFHVTQPCCITGRPGYRIVETVHDVIPLALGRRYFPLFRPDRKAGYRRQLATILKADRIIAYSRATADDLVRLLDLPDSTILVSPMGYDTRFKPVSDRGLIEERKSKYGIAGEYILFVGNMEWRKNLARLLRAFSAARKRCGEITLVIASRLAESERRKVQSLVRTLDIRNHVRMAGYIPPGDLVFIMNGARMLAFPSCYEGFGIPVLEAMACGTPILTSNVSSLPEVAGDAALLVDPYSDEEIRDGITRILSEEGLRRELGEKGLRRAGLFSWKKHAADVLKVYREVAGR